MPFEKKGYHLNPHCFRLSCFCNNKFASIGFFIIRITNSKRKQDLWIQKMVLNKIFLQLFCLYILFYSSNQNVSRRKSFIGDSVDTDFAVINSFKYLNKTIELFMNLDRRFLMLFYSFHLLYIGKNNYGRANKK